MACPGRPGRFARRRVTLRLARSVSLGNRICPLPTDHFPFISESGLERRRRVNADLVARNALPSDLICPCYGNGLDSTARDSLNFLPLKADVKYTSRRKPESGDVSCAYDHARNVVSVDEIVAMHSDVIGADEIPAAWSDSEVTVVGPDNNIEPEVKSRR